MIVFPSHFRNNRLLQIIADNWQEFKRLYPAYDNEYYDKVVCSVLTCSNPRFGLRQYMCLSCGEGNRIVAFSCKSRFCLRCGRVCGEKFSLSIKDRLHPDVVYRHLTLTIPEQLRIVFYQNRMDGRLFRLFFEAGWKCVQETVSEALGCKVECGCLSVLHLVGRSGEYKPHIHLLMMGGGINNETGNWQELRSFSYKILHMCWQRKLLEMIEIWDETGRYRELTVFLKENYPKGFVARIESGNLPKSSKHLVRYISKYLCRPQISQKWIKKYDKNHSEIEFEYRSHMTKKMEKVKLSALQFIGRLVQQILPKGFQRIRYYGLQATKNSDRLKYFVSKSVGSLYLPDKQEEKSEKENVVPKNKAGYRELVRLWWDNDPFRCPNCGGIMELVRIWDPVKGFVFSLFKNLFGKDIGPPGDLPEILLSNAEYG